MPSFRGPVAHLIAPAPAGGAESVVLALTSAAKDRTRAIILHQGAAPGAEDLPLTRQLRAAGVDVHEVRCGRRQYRAEAEAVARLVREHGVRLLHTHTYHAAIVGWMAARRARIDVVATAHGYLDRDLKERVYGMVDRWVMRRMNGVIAVSAGLETLLLAKGQHRAKLALIKNGLPAPARMLPRAEARAALGVAGDGPLVGWVGRLSIEKGADLFVDAMRATDPAVRAVIIGDGVERADLAARIGSDARVVLAGHRQDAASLLGAFDVLALSSRTEGTPMIVLESVNADLPVVSFRVGGIPDVLADDAAWLVPAGDAAALARAIDEAVRAPEQRRERARRAKSRLTAELGIESWLARVWDFYARVASH